MADASSNDVWAEGAAYERYVGRWSRLVAAKFLAWIAIPPGRAWLDVGCGTGALSAQILATQAPARLVGIDSSPAFVAHARAQNSDPRAAFQTGDARALPVADGGFDATVSGLVLNFVPDRRRPLPRCDARRGRAARSPSMSGTMPARCS
jgi:ubiquinone/menaquinone biosynthesis C-methylase UbiE